MCAFCFKPVLVNIFKLLLFFKKQKSEYEKKSIFRFAALTSCLGESDWLTPGRASALFKFASGFPSHGRHGATTNQVDEGLILINNNNKKHILDTPSHVVGIIVISTLHRSFFSGFGTV